MCGVGYVVAILCVYYWCGGAGSFFDCRKCWSGEGDIEVASVSHVWGGRGCILLGYHWG